MKLTMLENDPIFYLIVAMLSWLIADLRYNHKQIDKIDKCVTRHETLLKILLNKLRINES